MVKPNVPPFKIKITPITNLTIEELMLKNGFKSIVEKIIITKEALINKDA